MPERWVEAICFTKYVSLATVLHIVYLHHNKIYSYYISIIEVQFKLRQLWKGFKILKMLVDLGTYRNRIQLYF